MGVIELDGAHGEGGGQILRSALTLSMITGQPFCIRNIRANRPKPGLMRQHLAAVQAAAQVSGATVSGAEAGSQALSFEPGELRGGRYAFAIGSAGSCTLVLQTLLPALLRADAASEISISGGTHNAMAPPVQFLQRAYGRALADMGAEIDIRLKRYGFYPAGGGLVEASVAPCAQLRRIALPERGQRRHGYAESFIAGVPARVATRELEVIGVGMGWDAERLLHRGLPGEQGPGNALLVTLEHEHTTEVFAAFGEKTVRAEVVARNALQEVREFLASGAAVGEYLGDQLMLPMALAGGGSFTVHRVSQHALSNAAVIERFLPVRFTFTPSAGMSTCVVAALD
jgi:RNA 3'-terminal phosphate cyclase (ATP)